jgi:hypothetical protein
MSDATFQLLTSAAFIEAIGVGAIGVVIVLLWALFTKQPSTFGGVVLTGGIVVAIARTEAIPTGVLIGLGLLVVAGLVPTRSVLLTMAMAIPGAVVVAMTQLDSPSSIAAGLVAVTIIVLAPLVASFDDRYASSTLATPLMAISMVSVFLTVPDTKFVLLAAGVSLPWIIAGPPARLARLGRSGSLAAVGMLAWLVATGGFARPVALVAGIATLGVMVLWPLMWSIGGRGEPAPDDGTPVSGGTMVTLAAVHIAIQAVIAIVVRVT